MPLLILFILWTSFTGGHVMAEPTTCTTIIEHTKESAKNPWQTINDGVMGGLSSGGSALTDGVLSFAGNTNTNGGGFSSIRIPVARGVMAGTNRIKVHMKRDQRAYSLTLRTNVTLNGRQIAFRGPVVNATEGEWSDGVLFFDSLSASFRGRPVPDAVFDPAEVVELGVIIYDGRDGPFKIQLQRIEACQ